MASTLTRRRRGLALVAVLWVVAALSLLVGGLAMMAKGEVAAAWLRARSGDATAIGDAAIQLAVLDWRQANPAPDRLVRARYGFEGVEVEVEIVPANGYIDLNRAPESLLQALFVHGAGLAPEPALVLAQRIIDWRDVDDAPQPQGAETEQYLAAAVSTRPRNGPFVVPEDLMQVLDFDFDLFATISPFITVWSGSSGVNPLNAPEEVLAVLSANDVAEAGRVAAARDAGKIGIDTTTFDQGWLSAGNSDNILHVLAAIQIEPGRWAVRGRWVRLGSDPDGTPWMTIRAEPVRFVATPKGES
jgi:general secretion pathway protein K